MKLLQATLFILFSCNLYGAIWYVDIDATGSETGTSWTNAYTDLQDALDDSSEGDQIWIAAGTYYSDNIDPEKGFIASHPLTIYGGFNGSEMTSSQRDWFSNKVILSGEAGDPNDITDNRGLIFEIDSPSTTASAIDGITITDCLVKEYGLIDGGSVCTWRHCEFVDNQALLDYYLIYAASGADNVEIFDNCLIHNNVGRTILFAQSGFTEIINCTISQNTVISTFSPSIFASNSLGETNIFNTIIYDNVATQEISTNGADVTISNSFFEIEELFNQWGSIDTTNISFNDPLFSDVANGDFGLQKLSPAINFGGGEFVSTFLDFKNEPRVIQWKVDAGCIENQRPGVILVDELADGDNNGKTWADAFNTIQGAIDISDPGDEIWISEGTYKGPNGAPSVSVIGVPHELYIYGGFTGFEFARELRNYADHPVIISGENGDDQDDTDNQNFLLSIQSYDDPFEVVIDGLIFENCYHDGLALGGIQLNDADVVLDNCIFRENLSINSSLISMSDLGESYFENCLFRDNICNSAIVSTEAEKNFFINCTITENTVLESNGELIQMNANSSLNYFSNSITYGNAAANDIGAQFGESNSVNLQRSIFENPFENMVVDSNMVLIEDPLFENPANNNFKLSAASPAREVGFNLSTFDTEKDLAGKDRIVKFNVDLGCYEYQRPDIIFVNDDAPGSNSGKSWHNAFKDLNSALGFAQSDQEIWVAEGLYKPAESDRFASFELVEGCPLLGGFEPGMESKELKNHSEYPSIISGNIGGLAINLDNSYRLFSAETNGLDITIDGFIIQKARANNEDLIGYDAASVLFVTGSGNGTIKFKNNIVQYNQGDFGNHIRVTAGALLAINNCSFYSNECETGSNLISSDTSVVIESSLMAENIGGNSIVDASDNTTWINNTIVNYTTAESSPVILSTEVDPNDVHRFYNCILDVDEAMVLTDGLATDVLIFNSIISGTLGDSGWNGGMNLNVSPNFNNAEESDYTLLPSSDAISLGDESVINGNFDLAGNERINDELDAGCFEFYGEIIIGCPGDFNDDDVVNADDLLTFLSAYGCTSSCGEPDLTGDDTVNAEDLLAFLSYYGVTCGE